MNIDPQKIARMISEDPNEVAPGDHFDDTEDEYMDEDTEALVGVHSPEKGTEIHVDLVSRGDDQDEWKIEYLSYNSPASLVAGSRSEGISPVHLQGILTIYHVEGLSIGSRKFNGWDWEGADEESDHATDEIQQILDCFAEAYTGE